MTRDTPQQKSKVLIVDDNPTNLSLVADYLEEFDFLIMTARTSEKGIEQARHGQPDLILLDIMMPGINGFEACQRLKQDAATRDIPIIFMTALSDVDDQVKGFAIGGIDYITKPIKREVVLARVRTHLKLRAQQRQLEQQAFELEQSWQLAEECRKAADKANQAKSVFLANMSHELRTPLNTILGFAQIMAHDPHTEQEGEYLRIIQRSGEHLLALINQVLDLSKIEAGRITLDEKDIDLHWLLDNLNDMFFIKAMHKGLQLSFERAPDVPRTIRADEVKLRQVLINLLNNAIKFTEEGSVTFKIENCQLNIEDSLMFNLQFSIADTGPGIAPEEMGQLFEAFGQTILGRQAPEGTGLGLTISRKFVQLMGGDIHVSSEVGVGSTFSFNITVERVEQDTSPELHEASIMRPVALEPGQPRYRVLIVDDNPDNRKLLAALFAPFEFDLREAANGQKAVDVWREWQPHMIWMDLRMPIMSGYEAIQRIRELEHPRTTKIIVISASGFEDERTAALARGGDDFLRKPFRETEIFARLEQHSGLRFVYERKQSAAQTRPEAILDPDTLTATIARLPSDLSNAFIRATQECDMLQMHDLITQIRPEYPSVADALIQLTENFEYTRLLSLFGAG